MRFLQWLLQRLPLGNLLKTSHALFLGILLKICLAIPPMVQQFLQRLFQELLQRLPQESLQRLLKILLLGILPIVPARISLCSLSEISPKISWYFL